MNVLRNNRKESDLEMRLVKPVNQMMKSVNPGLQWCTTVVIKLLLVRKALSFLGPSLKCHAPCPTPEACPQYLGAPGKAASKSTAVESREPSWEWWVHDCGGIQVWGVRFQLLSGRGGGGRNGEETVTRPPSNVFIKTDFYTFCCSLTFICSTSAHHFLWNIEWGFSTCS